MLPDWTTDIDPKDPKLAKKADNLKLIFDEAQKRLTSTEKDHEIMTTKAQVVLGFALTITSGVAAFYFQKGITGLEGVMTLLPLTAFAVFSYKAIGSLLEVLRPVNFEVSGYNPEKLHQKKTVYKTNVAVLCVLIKSYGKKIKANLETNHDKRIAFDDAIRSLSWANGSLVFGLLLIKAILLAASFPRIVVFLVFASLRHL